mgnify:CR=1 FL=1
MPIYPVWLNDGKEPKPEKKVFYEIAANGTFIHKENPFWKAVVPVKQISILEESSPSFETSLPPISAEITAKIARFFAWIAQTQNTESMVLLWWNEIDNSYAVTAPPQQVEYGGINYNYQNNPGCRLIGTIHSHGRIPANHSTTDHADEEFFDGIHGTFGDFVGNKNEFEISLQASINNSRFWLNPLDYFEGIKVVDRYGAIGISRNKTDINTDKSPAVLDISNRDLFSRNRWRNPFPRFFALKEIELLIDKNYQPPQEWLAMVKRVK